MSVVNDPISDMLTRIRNAGQARRTETSMPSTKVLVELAKILHAEGYVRGWTVEEGTPYNTLTVHLKYGPDRRHSIRQIKRISKPGLRVYARKTEIPQVRNGLGIAIVSTPQGMMTGYEARRRGIGGEVVCTVY